MLEPKRISIDSVSAALEKALRYRLLNEPLEAESICRDILAVDPTNQDAIVTLLLALTDQFDRQFSPDMDSVKELIPQLSGEFEREYYAGIILERWGKAQMTNKVPREIATGWFRQGMRHFERAIELAQPDDPDAILRWNTCARILEKSGRDVTAAASVSHDIQADFGDDVPLR